MSDGVPFGHRDFEPRFLLPSDGRRHRPIERHATLMLAALDNGDIDTASEAAEALWHVIADRLALNFGDRKTLTECMKEEKERYMGTLKELIQLRREVEAGPR